MQHHSELPERGVPPGSRRLRHGLPGGGHGHELHFCAETRLKGTRGALRHLRVALLGARPPQHARQQLPRAPLSDHEGLVFFLRLRPIVPIVEDKQFVYFLLEAALGGDLYGLFNTHQVGL